MQKFQESAWFLHLTPEIDIFSNSALSKYLEADAWIS